MPEASWPACMHRDYAKQIHGIGSRGPIRLAPNMSAIAFPFTRWTTVFLRCWTYPYNPLFILYSASFPHRWLFGITALHSPSYVSLGMNIITGRRCQPTTHRALSSDWVHSISYDTSWKMDEVKHPKKKKNKAGKFVHTARRKWLCMVSKSGLVDRKLGYRREQVWDSGAFKGYLGYQVQDRWKWRGKWVTK